MKSVRNGPAQEQFGAVVSHKLNFPKGSPAQVTRSALCDLMGDNEQTRLVLINAPAGFGKTTLMLQARMRLEEQGVRCAWISLDDADNDPARFLMFLAAAFERACDDVRSGERTSLFAGTRSLGSLALEFFKRLALFDQPFALFLDDFETIQSTAVSDLLHELVRHLPEKGRVVIGSRQLPELGLGRLRATGQLRELGAEHLRFNLEDTTTFLRDRRGLRLDPAVIARLHDRTEGWVAALWLASVALENQARPADFIAGFSGTSNAIAAYLAEDVLARLGEEERDFLLRTSILETLSAPVCDAVCGREGSQVLLDRLSRANLFLQPLDDDRQHFRYHKLFAQFLQEQLRRQMPGELPRIRRAAAEWQRAAGKPIAAIDHAFATGDDDYAAALLDEHAERLLGEGRTRVLMRWLDRASPDMLQARPRLRAVHLWATAFSHSMEGALATLERLETSGLDDPALRAHLLALRPVLLTQLDRVEDAHAVGQKNFEHLDPQHAFAYIMLANTMAHLSFTLGQFDQARAYLEASRRAQGRDDRRKLHLAFSEAVEGDIDLLQGRLRQAMARFRLGVQSEGAGSSGTLIIGVPMAETLYEVDDRDQAERMLQVYLPLTREIQLPDHMMSGHVTLARILALRGDSVGALQLLGELEQHGHAANLPRAVATAKLERARMALLRGDVAAANVELQQAGGMGYGHQMTQWCTIVNDFETPTIGRLRWMIHAGSAQAAVPLLRHELAQSERTGRLRRALKLRILLALGLRGSNESRKALEVLEEAIRRSASEGFIRIYADEGQRMAELIAEYVAAHPARGAVRSQSIDHDYLDRLLNACRGSGPVERGPRSAEHAMPVEALTPAELKVLQQLAEGLSNLVIAERLFISEATVRTHLRSINVKLNAQNRTQAVAIGRRLGLTP
ncbi:LuxR C-terminal-related transcriptional regulator [Lysobacter fragariae]